MKRKQEGHEFEASLGYIKQNKESRKVKQVLSGCWYQREGDVRKGCGR
jgi:hypothetical protein